MQLTRLISKLLLIATSLSSGLALAQNYPNKPIRIVATEAGGSGDLVIRLLLGQGLPNQLGQRMIVDDRAGAAVAGESSKERRPMVIPCSL